MTSLAAAFLDLVVPLTCVACGAEGALWCGACADRARRSFGPRPAPPPLAGRAIDLWSIGPYEGVWRDFIVRAKHDQRLDLAPTLTALGCDIGRQMAHAGYTPRWVVPAPSRWRRRLSRHWVAHPFADGIARGLAEGGVRPIACVDVVRLKAFGPTQAGRDTRERLRGRAGQMRSLAALDGDIVLVDDVTTSGATLAEMARVLGPGARVAVTLAAASVPSSFS